MDRFDPLIQQLRRRVPQLELREREPLSAHTTFRIGGPARLMALPKSREEAIAAVQAARALDLSPFFLGNGSDLLVSDEGYDGFVIKTGGLDQAICTGERLEAGSGLLLSRLATAAYQNGLTGLEFAHGIPGSVGGGAVMNAGAYGGELSQVLTSITFLDEEGEPVTLPAGACALTYRHTIFTDHPQWLILEAGFALSPGDPVAIKARMDELGQRRRSKQPLDLPSAGSTFKRPEGHFAGALIEQCGLKGVGVGGAQVSEKHAGFVVNRGGATADDVRRLMELIQSTVLRETGVMLEPEVKFLGF